MDTDTTVVETRSILNTPVNELTVAQTVKANLFVGLLTVAAAGAAIGGAVAVERFGGWWRRRKAPKTTVVPGRCTQITDVN